MHCDDNPCLTSLPSLSVEQSQRQVTDLYEDLRDGHNLISLLEVLSGETLVSTADFWLVNGLTLTTDPDFWLANGLTSPDPNPKKQKSNPYLYLPNPNRYTIPEAKQNIS